MEHVVAYPGECINATIVVDLDHAHYTLHVRYSSNFPYNSLHATRAASGLSYWKFADTKQAVNVNAKHPLKATSLNWDAHPQGPGQPTAPILSPRDVVQVAFILDQQSGAEHPENDEPSSVVGSKRVLGQLAIQWRGALGDRGSLSTGWLTCRR